MKFHMILQIESLVLVKDQPVLSTEQLLARDPSDPIGLIKQYIASV